MSEHEKITETIVKNAAGPKSAEVDGQRVARRRLGTGRRDAREDQQCDEQTFHIGKPLFWMVFCSCRRAAGRVTG